MIDPNPGRQRAKEHGHFQVLMYLDGIEPRVWRRVLLRKRTTLHELHRVIQMLFDWYDYHLYRFEIGEEQYEAPDEEAEGHDSTKARLDHLGVGPHAYSELLKALRKPFEQLEDWEQEKVEWIGEDFDPEEFSLTQARHDLMLTSAWGTLKRRR